MLIGATLGLYFSLRFGKTILMVFGTVFALVYTIDFVELMRRAGDAEGASAGLMAQLALFRTPALADQVLPFAILFGSMATLLHLSRKLELVVALLKAADDRTEEPASEAVRDIEAPGCHHGRARSTRRHSRRQSSIAST